MLSLLVLLACTGSPDPQTPSPEGQEMAKAKGGKAKHGKAKAGKGGKAKAGKGKAKSEGQLGKLILDGETVEVSWNDGDTFATEGEDGGKGIKARLAGFNTLESYGPVHRWGDWTPQELFLLSKKAGDRAASEVWTCTDTGKGGGYGRSLVDCPDLRRALLSEGLAHVFTLTEEADPADLAAQAQAIEGKVGMWAKGAPEGLLTSLHSLDEYTDKTETYNRVADLKTGKAEESTHSTNYTTCQEVCVEGSCMIYVPYELRYGPKKADCLKGAGQ
ncbi:MAG: nuclease [Alphaproteobacteria bacterium]|nr:nuclease [Alphaproteobacteria bacterium]